MPHGHTIRRFIRISHHRSKITNNVDRKRIAHKETPDMACATSGVRNGVDQHDRPANRSAIPGQPVRPVFNSAPALPPGRCLVPSHFAAAAAVAPAASAARRRRVQARRNILIINSAYTHRSAYKKGLVREFVPLRQASRKDAFEVSYFTLLLRAFDLTRRLLADFPDRHHQLRQADHPA